MRHRAMLVTALMLVGLAAAPGAGAQSDSDFAAYLGMISTPNGSLPPLATALPQDGFGGPAVNLRYGRIDFGGGSELNAYGFGVAFAGGPRSRAAITGGLFQGSCSGCKAYPMLGATYGGAILPARSEAETNMSVGIDLELGFSNPESITILSAGASLPMAVSSPIAKGGRVSAFVAPGLGVAHLTGHGESESGARPTVGGGIGVQTGSGIGFNVGMRQVIVRNGDAQFGVGVSYGGRR